MQESLDKTNQTFNLFKKNSDRVNFSNRFGHRFNKRTKKTTT